MGEWERLHGLGGEEEKIAQKKVCRRTTGIRCHQMPSHRQLVSSRPVRTQTGCALDGKSDHEMPEVFVKLSVFRASGDLWIANSVSYLKEICIFQHKS